MNLAKPLRLIDDILRSGVYDEDKLKEVRALLSVAFPPTLKPLDNFEPAVRESIRQLIMPQMPEWTQENVEDNSRRTWPSPAVQYPVKIRKHLRQALKDPAYNCFALEAITTGHALSSLFYYILEEEGMFDRIGLVRHKARAFATAVESSYEDQPYHNSVHVACVLHAMYHLLHTGEMLVGISDDLQILMCLAAYVAAAVHDIAHPGVTNGFLVKTRHELAQMYHDQSVCEHHHLNRFFVLLNTPEYNFRENIDEVTCEYLRKLVIGMVLKTDMQQHLITCKEFADSEPDNTPPILLLQMALKVADLVHTTYPWDLHLTWIKLLEQENFRQGDKEKELGIPVSPLMDRTGYGLQVSQSGFFSVVVVPMLETFCSRFPKTSMYLQGATQNLTHWQHDGGQR